jgi:FkbM family methyltransferase
MTTYWEPEFVNALKDVDVKVVFEAGARTGEETITLSNIFPSANVYSFECNPMVVQVTRAALSGRPNIHFFPYGLGDKNESLPFYSFMDGNIGASSLFKRTDFYRTQTETGHVDILKLNDFVKKNDIQEIDLLCMDVQGYELNILKGAEDFIEKIKYMIIEEPKKNPLNKYYIGAPDAEEIQEFLKKHNFVEIVRLQENLNEDNVMYKNIRF